MQTASRLKLLKKMVSMVKCSINYFKNGFELAKHRIRDERTFHTDLLLIDITQLISVTLVVNIN